MNRLLLITVVLLSVVACGPRQLEPDAALDCDRCADWNRAQKPFRIFGNTWYVGTEGLSAILIEAGDKLILIDAGLPQSAAVIVDNIRELGFEPLKISAILVSHPHFDHAGGVAALQRYTGAAVYTSSAAEATLVSGALQPGDPQFVDGDTGADFPAVAQVTVVEDDSVVTVGDVDVRAVYTPGHTPGGTTWTWESCALNSCMQVVYADSLTAVSAPGYRFTDGAAANQLIESAGKVGALDCDILLSPHPFFFGLQDKLARRQAGNPFINNVGCMMYAESALGWIEQRLRSEGG